MKIFNRLSWTGLWVSDALTSPVFALLSFLVLLYINAYENLGHNTVDINKPIFLLFLFGFSGLWLLLSYLWAPVYINTRSKRWLKIFVWKMPCLIPFVCWFFPIQGSVVAFILMPLTASLFVYGMMVNSVVFLSAKRVNETLCLSLKSVKINE